MLEISDYLFNILFYLNEKDVQNVFRVSKRTSSIIKDNVLLLIQNILGNEYKIFKYKNCISFTCRTKKGHKTITFKKNFKNLFTHI